jgi:hypothetical protein
LPDDALRIVAKGEKEDGPPLIDELKPAILDLSLHRQSDGGGRWRTQWQLHWLQGQVAASDWLPPSLWRAAVTP